MTIMRRAPRRSLLTHTKHAGAALAAAVLLAGALAGCTAPVTPSPTPSLTPSATSLFENRINDAHICGQVSTLGTMVIYANYDFDHGLIDAAARDDRYRAVAEGWLNILTMGDLSVTSSVQAAQVQFRAVAAARGSDFVPTEQELQTIRGRCGPGVPRRRHTGRLQGRARPGLVPQSGGPQSRCQASSSSCQPGESSASSNGTWQGSVCDHHSCETGSASIFAWSAS